MSCRQPGITLARVTPAIGVVGGLLVLGGEGLGLGLVLSSVFADPALAPLGGELWAHSRPVCKC